MREMGRGALVESDQLVKLLRGEPPRAAARLADELVEAPPRVLVQRDEAVDVDDRIVGAATVRPMTDLAGVVIPEAVRLELPPAGIATRMFAKLVDLACQATALMVGGWISSVIALAEGPSAPITRAFLIAWGFLVLIVAPGAVEGRWNGRTPGKALVGLRVVDLDGGPVTWRQALLRGLAQLIDVYIPLGLFPALATRRSQRFGDLLAGTFVLVERPMTVASLPVAFTAPPGAEHYAATLDVGRLRSEQYRLVRAFLLRVHELEPSARWQLSVRLANAVREMVEPAPPPGMSPEVFLVCVAAAYQTRSGGHVIPVAPGASTIGVHP
jgi:uncharacterized RDD family membrane protein YckC